MKSSCNKEETAKKYASFSNLDSAKSTKTSVGVSQCGQQRKNVESTSVDVLVEKSDKTSFKTSENILLHNSIQPYPFTFLTAVKRKLALGRNYPICKKVYEPKQINEEIEGTMAFVKPLKVPDLKISSKADYSSRESLLSSEELSKKIEAVQRDEMSIKSTDRVSRKLEFSSCAASMLNYENVDSPKISDLSISKKKDLSRDSSREKENRSKRVKKDDFNTCKNKDDLQDVSKWSKTRHISRKDIADSIIHRKLKSDCILSHRPKETDIIFKKSKTKNFATSTAKKDEEKRHKYSNIPSIKSKKDISLDSKNRTSSSDSNYPIDKVTRLHEKILIREGCKAMISEPNDRKYKDDSQIVNTSKQSDEQKYKSLLETRLQKHQGKSNTIKPIESLTRDQSKRFSDKQKSNSKLESKHSSEISEDLTTAVTSIASLAKSQSLGIEASSSILSKSKDMEKTPQSSNNRNSEECKYSDTFSHAASSNLGSSSTIIETKISQDISLSEKLMDPMRISFRDDSYSNQPEFVDLVTPDMNLMIRSKRRKQAIQTWENDNDQKDSKQRLPKNGQDIEVQSKQLKPEMNLLDSISESLRQVINVERLKLSNDEVKRCEISLQNDHKDVDAKKTEAESSESKDDGKNKIQKPSVKVVEVHTQTANDIATQTDTMLCQRTVNTNLAYSRVSIDPSEVPHISLNSEDRYENMDRVEDISLPSKMRTMSEISLHETTSSIKTETGTEISISTRDVTYSFNKYLDLEMAQLIKDEKQRYDKIEMLFKSREKTLNDRTKKLVKLEEQKRALRDTGQDSRISSVKKKQRALLLKLQQEKDEMNRLKELHKIASQERKLMLQKQRDMFNPEMSTKNILNKLKRSADSQSPRRLSGPMKGYDIRSNSSVSSLVDSDKSQLDRSQIDLKLNLSDIMSQRDEQTCSRIELNTSIKQSLHSTDNIDRKLSKNETSKQKEAAAAKIKYDLKMRKFEGKMPKSDQLKLKTQQYDMDAIIKHGGSAVSLLKNESRASQSQDEDNQSISEHVKSESDVLIEEFTQIWKSQFPDLHSESFDLIEASNSFEALGEVQKTSSSKKLDKEAIKKFEQDVVSDNKNAKRKGVKGQRSKPIQTESTSKSEDSHYVEETFRHHNKRSKIDSEQQSDDNYQNSILEELDFNESQSSLQALLKHSNLLKERNQQLLQDIVDESRHAVAENSESPLSQKDDEERMRRGNASSRSQVSLTISHQSSNDSDRSYSRSVVIRSQQDHHHHRTGLKTSKKLEQILNARETTLVSRRNCVEEWIAWHARLREEENRVARMEQAAYKLVTATAKALSHNDTTVSSDTSDVEGRIEQLTQKLADRRLEMARLKKELRKQAKQRLKALEANLLNEIKKYDATIHDMRKKLELRRGTADKEIENLAIEPKSVVDFKVPEISLKKIQEIYRTSDLLRSKSDSDIISVKNRRKDEKCKDNNLKSNDTEKNLSRTKNTNQSKHLPSLYTVCDEEHELSEKSDHSAVHSYKTKSSSEEIATQKSITTEGQDIKRSSSQSSNISEEIPSEAYSVKSQTEQLKAAKITETPTSQSTSERIEYGTSEVLSKADPKESNIIDEDVTPFDDESMMFSKNLDHIHLHNKELNDDIHNLANDLKELTKLMSNFSKKSDSKDSKSIDLTDTTKNNEKSTSKDISEELPASEMILQIENIDEDLQARVNTILSDVIPETDDLLSSIEQLDTRAKNLKNINESEKSKLSECTNKSTATEEILTDLPSHTENVDLSFSVNHYKNNGSYVSEILSTPVDEDKENTSPNESHLSIHRTCKSPDGTASSEIDRECLDFNKLNSKHVQENKINESAEFRESKDISTDEVITLESRENQLIEDKGHILFKDKNSEIEISTAEDTAINENISLKISEIEDNEDQIYTEIDDKYTESISSTSKEVSEIVSLEGNRKQISEDQIYTTNDKFIESKTSLVEDVSTNKIIDLKTVDTKIVEDEINSKTEDKYIKPKFSIIDEVNQEKVEENIDSASDNGWSLSESFNFECSKDKLSPVKSKETPYLKYNKNENRNEISAFDDSAMFIPKGESTNIQETFELRLDDTSESRIGIRSDEFNDILEIIERETKNDDVIISNSEVQKNLTEKPNVSEVDVKIESPINCDIISMIKTKEAELESIEKEIESKNDVTDSEHISHKLLLADEDSPRIHIGVNTELMDAEDEKSVKQDKVRVNEIKEINGEDRISSDGEQLDNLIEIAESKLDTMEKLTSFDEKITGKEDIGTVTNRPKTHVQVFLNRTFDVIKDPDYEDISEESLEVSEILDKTESRSNQKSKKFSTIPEKYINKSNSNDVLRILDDISNKSASNFKRDDQDARVNEDGSNFKVSASEAKYNDEDVVPTSIQPELNNFEIANAKLSKEIESEVDSIQEFSKHEIITNEDSKSTTEDVREKQDLLKVSSESSESGALDTPRGVSEIEMDSPREINEDSRLDVDALDDDLLSGNAVLLRTHGNDVKREFNPAPMSATTTEKDITAMIDKLKASLEQPGLDNAELDAKLLQLEHLEIELEIKKLEVEESYYVREIPNKPPPPYTPPGAGRLASSHGSPSPPPAVIPTNVEELTAVTEKATTIIYKEKESGKDVLSLEAPTEICELAKDNSSDSLKKDRRIYNTFLFDLCKELVAEMYKSEYDGPGPSWTKPNVQTKPTAKIARTVNELNDYVSREVATLFGFKTRLQRENMVMRWSRKKRDMVDELLAKEAQAEEKEWTKFHHDELAVKNKLTIKILDTLLLETANCVKTAYAKKRKLAAT